MSRAEDVLRRFVCSRAGLAVAAAASVGSFAIAATTVATDFQYQWDFEHYVHMSKALDAGENPHDPEVISRHIGYQTGLGYTYPAPTLRFWSLFLPLWEATAHWLWLGLKLFALAALIGGWLWAFAKDHGARAILLLVAAFGFARGLWLDLTAGNISTYEEMVIWAGLFAFLRGRTLLAGLLLGVSGLMKWVTVSLLGLLPFIRRGWRPWAGVGIGVAFILAWAVNCYTRYPHLFTNQMGRLAVLDERGRINPSSFALFRDLTEAVGFTRPTAAWVLQALLVLAVAAAGLWAIAGKDREAYRTEIVFLALLAYGTAMPRMKPYSYVLLMVPAAMVLRRALDERPWLAIALGLLVCTRLLAYQPFFAATALFIVACQQMRRGVSQSPS